MHPVHKQRKMIIYNKNNCNFYKDCNNAQVRFYYKSGEEIKFNKLQTGAALKDKYVKIRP